MDESQGRHAEWKKTVSKGYIPYDSIYVIFSKSQNYSDPWFPGNRVEVMWLQRGSMGWAEFGGMMELFCDCGGGGDCYTHLHMC